MPQTIEEPEQEFSEGHQVIFWYSSVEAGSVEKMFGFDVLLQHTEDKDRERSPGYVEQHQVPGVVQGFYGQVGVELVEKLGSWVKNLL